jgi:endonuclease/exonuclease/phosphatase family metal-dependent hydrolase
MTAPHSPTTLRVLTLNLWNRSGDVERRMEVALAGVRALAPDLIGLQEVIEHPDGGMRQAETFARAIGGDFRFAAADPHSAGGPIGNAVVSRLPLGASASRMLPGPDHDPRVVLAVEVATPMGPMCFLSTHLSWELDAAPVRERQVVALDAFARLHRRQLPSVMTGDFNATPDTDAIRFLTGRSSIDGVGTYWRDAFARVHPHGDGHTWSADNPYVARHVERNRRIDFIFVGPIGLDERGAIVDARVVLDVPGHGGVFASDHFGVYAEIDLAPNPGGK